MTSATPASRSVRLFQTAPHPCGYFADRTAQDLLLDPWESELGNAYSMALAAGFRRSGTQVYRPHCPNCRACQPMRLELAKFRPNRSQKRCLQRNADLRLLDDVDAPTDEHFALFDRYLGSRHRDGGMDQGDAGDFLRFASSSFSHTRFLELRLDQQLVAVAITDVLPNALSAVYTCFATELAERSLGTLAILQQIEWGLQQGKKHLYLGFYISKHPKMDYKLRFQPAELLGSKGWGPLQQIEIQTPAVDPGPASG